MVKTNSFIILLIASILLTGCAPEPEEQPLDEVTVQLAWTHQSQFAGFYAAEQQGYYAEEGLKVNLVPKLEFQLNVITEVLDQRADFGISDGMALVKARSIGQNVTAFSTILRHNPLVFFTLAESGITRPQDFSNHTMKEMPIGRGADNIYRSMMSNLGLKPDDVDWVEVGFDLSPFINGEVEIWVGWIIDDVQSLREQGYPLNLILPDTYGVHTYGDTLFAGDEFIQDNPDLVLRFLRATLRGWQWAIENPVEAGGLALLYDPTLDTAHQLGFMESSVPLIHTGEDHIGWMKFEVWQEMYDILLEQGLLNSPYDVRQVYTLEFIEIIYGNE